MTDDPYDMRANSVYKLREELAFALTERDALRAENAGLREALDKAAIFLAIASSQTGSEPLAKAAKSAARAAYLGGGGKMTDWVANEIEGSKKFMQDIVQENIDLRARNAKLEASLKPFVEQYDAVVAEFGMLPDDANSIVKFGELRDASEAIKGK